ncbi:MAG: DIP1984 family protein [Candidatus Sericytochromatia bacterium]
MKLAEALILRADCQKKIAQINDRLSKNALIQDGETPSEKPEDLLNELDSTLIELQNLIKSINKTNSIVEFETNKTLADALAERDILVLEIRAIQALLNSSKVVINRYSQSEIKYKSTINIANTQKKLDDLSKKHRILDTKIQELNWKYDLI